MIKVIFKHDSTFTPEELAFKNKNDLKAWFTGVYGEECNEFNSEVDSETLAFGIEGTYTAFIISYLGE